MKASYIPNIRNESKVVLKEEKKCQNFLDSPVCNSTGCLSGVTSLNPQLKKKIFFTIFDQAHCYMKHLSLTNGPKDCQSGISK